MPDHDKTRAINQRAVERFKIDPTVSLSTIYLNSFVTEDASRTPQYHYLQHKFNFLLSLTCNNLLEDN